jgi:Ni/Fe-hydrogenase subunit HybB-like protein
MKNGNRAYYVWLGVLGVFVLAGLVTALRLLTEGHVLFNTNDVILWSLPLGAYIFLALTSSGLTLLSAIPLVFGVKKYEPLAKRLVFLSIATLCGAFVSIGLELGNVWHMIYIMLSPNLSSPIWWMGAIYSAEMVLLVVKFWRMSIGDWSSLLSKYVGMASFLCALVAPLMIGSVFGITESRVTYFGPVMSIYCLLMAMLSGVALFVLYSTVYHKVMGEPVTAGQKVIYDEISLMLKYIAGAVLVFTLVKIAIETATKVPEFLMIRKYEHTFGTVFGLQTEVAFGLVLPFILLLFSGLRKSDAGKTVASALLWVGTLGMHMGILISGQSHPIGPKAEQYGEALTYFPSISEWLVFTLALAVMLALYTLGERYLHLGRMREPEARPSAA